MKKYWKIILGVIGVLLTILGWFLSNTEQISWVKKIIAPHFLSFNENFYKIQNPGYILSPGDDGFEAIESILKEQIDQPDKPKILRIKTRKWGWGTGTDKFKPIQGSNIEFDVNLHTGQVLPMLVWNIEEKVASKLNRTVYFWSSMIFWIGMVFSTLSLLKD